MRSHRSRWIWVMLAAIVLLVVVASGLLVAYLVLRGRQPAAVGWKDPVAAVAPEKILASLALYPLAGTSELDVIDAATERGELATAYASLVFSVDLADQQRIGRLSALAEALAGTGEQDLARQCYQQIYDLAVLSPRLNDPMRADALRTAADGWAELGQRERAVGAYEEVYRLAVEGTHLQLAQRRALLGELLAAYQRLGDGARADDVRSRVAQLDERGPSGPTSPALAWPELPSGDRSVSTSEIGALEEARRGAAYALWSSLDAGAEAAQDLASGLTEALKAEDAAKLAWYNQELGSTTQPGRRIDLQWQVIRWLLLKYRVAQKGFGLSLVPEWETALPQIRRDLGAAYGELLYAYEDLMTALPDASLIAPGRYRARCLVMLAGRLGLYPDYPADQMAADLAVVEAELAAAGHTGDLFVDASDLAGGQGLSLRRGADLQAP